MLLRPKAVAIVVLIFAICLPQRGFTQSLYDMSYIGLEQGLPDRHITAMMQDDNGFMWFGSYQGGLIRYDGVKYENYSTEKTKSIQLKDNRVTSIIKTKSGELWVANLGITIVNPKTLSCRQVLTSPIHTLYRDSKGVIWGSDSLGIFKILNDDINQIQRLQRSTDGDIFHLINRDKLGKLWFISFKATYYLDEHDQFVLAQKNTAADPYSAIIFPVKNLEGDFVAFTYPGQNKYIWVEQPQTFTKQYPPDGLNWHFFKANYQFYERDLEKLVPDIDRGYFYHYLSSDNTLWVGSQNGILKIRTHNNLFTTCPDFKNCSSRGILEDTITKKVLVSTYSGLREYSPKQNSAKVLSRDLAYALLYKKGHKLLIMSELKGLRWWDLKQQKQLEVKGLPKLATSASYGYLIGKDHKVLFTHGGRIYRYDIDKDSVEKSKYDLSEQLDSTSGKIMTLYKTKNGMLCVATFKGLFAMDENKGIITFPFSNDERLGRNSYILSMYEDDQGLLWLASANYGVVCLNPKAGTIVSYTTTEGLAHMETYAILSDDGGKTLWISTASGLSHFDTQKKTFKNYYQTSGLAHNEFNSGSYLHASDGSFYFGGINGISRFFPKSIQEQSNAIKPLLSEYTIYSTNDSTRKYRNLGELPSLISLSPKDNIIEFVLSSNDFFENEKNIYAYQLVNFDKNWINSGKNNIVRYMNLPAGDYVFKVKTFGSLGQWSDNFMEIPIHVDQIFYKKAWFIALVAALLVLLMWGILQLRLRQIQKENEIRLNIAANIHDDLGGTLYAINSSARQLKANATNTDNVSEVNQLVEFCEEAYRNMGELIWAINPDNQYIYSLLDRMEDNKDSILQSYTKVTTFEISGFNTKQKINVEMKQHILMIFKESLVNIVKHTNPQKISIHVSNEPVFTLNITSYFEEKKETAFSSGKGLNSMQQRAKQLGGILTIKSDKNDHSINLRLKKPI